MSKKIATKFVKVVKVIDPDSGNEVEVEIRKMETGGMVGIDGSFLEQDVGPVYSPYDKNVEIHIPDDEEKIPKGTQDTGEETEHDQVV